MLAIHMVVVVQDVRSEDRREALGSGVGEGQPEIPFYSSLFTALSLPRPMQRWTLQQQLWRKNTRR